jgi:hypothetical protein
VSLVDVEITGATGAAVELAEAGTSTLMASDIRGNTGSALIVRDGHKPRISHNTFARNGSTERGATFVIRKASPAFVKNIFVGSTAGSFATLDSTAEDELRRDNVFVSADQLPSSR